MPDQSASYPARLSIVIHGSWQHDNLTILSPRCCVNIMPLYRATDAPCPTLSAVSFANQLESRRWYHHHARPAFGHPSGVLTDFLWTFDSHGGSSYIIRVFKIPMPAFPLQPFY